MQLILPDATSLALPELITQAIEFVSQLTTEETREVEQKAGLLRQLHRGEKRYAMLHLASARRLGIELPAPAKGGRGCLAENPLDLSGDARRIYRDAAEPTDEEFSAWFQEAKHLSKTALAVLGKKLRKKRDRETGEPIEHGRSAVDGGGPPASSGAAADPAPVASDPAPQGPPEPDLEKRAAEAFEHTARLEVAKRLREDLGALLEDEQPWAHEVGRLLRRALSVATA